MNLPVDAGPLGQTSDYPSTYTPSLLHSIERAQARQRSGVAPDQAWRGEDVWQGYEFSWLDTQGKPLVAGLRLRVPCQSKALVESKSLKLYLNSFAQTKFGSRSEVLTTLDKDLTLAFRSPVMVELLELAQLSAAVQQLSGVCLDDLDVRIRTYERDAALLAVEDADRIVTETLHSHLFRSLCPVTGQPDWASVSVAYQGAAIDRSALLKYLISYRNHQAFHETTVELIYQDLLAACQPVQLSVQGLFVRRGGLDINPFRSTHEDGSTLCRLPRQ